MPPIGANIVVSGLRRPFCRKERDILVGEAENAQFVLRGLKRRLRRAQVVLRLDQVGLALLIVLERHRLALEQVLGALVLDLREIERGLAPCSGSSSRR